MCTLKTIAAACFVAAITTSVLADSVPTLKPGEAVAIMPDGRMGRETLSDATKVDDLLKMSKPIYDCVMLLADAKGRVHLVDTSTHRPMVACENLAP